MFLFWRLDCVVVAFFSRRNNNNTSIRRRRENDEELVRWNINQTPVVVVCPIILTSNSFCCRQQKKKLRLDNLWWWRAQPLTHIHACRISSSIAVVKNGIFKNVFNLFSFRFFSVSCFKHSVSQIWPSTSCRSPPSFLFTFVYTLTFHYSEIIQKDYVYQVWA